MGRRGGAQGARLVNETFSTAPNARESQQNQDIRRRLTHKPKVGSVKHQQDTAPKKAGEDSADKEMPVH